MFAEAALWAHTCTHSLMTECRKTRDVFNVLFENFQFHFLLSLFDRGDGVRCNLCFLFSFFFIHFAHQAYRAHTHFSTQE